MLHLAWAIKPKYMRFLFDRRTLYSMCHLFAIAWFLILLLLVFLVYEERKSFKKSEESLSIDTSELYWGSLVRITLLVFIPLFAAQIIISILEYAYQIDFIDYLVYLGITGIAAGVLSYLYLFPPLRELKRVEVFPRVTLDSVSRFIEEAQRIYVPLEPYVTQSLLEFLYVRIDRFKPILHQLANYDREIMRLLSRLEECTGAGLMSLEDKKRIERTLKAIPGLIAFAFIQVVNFMILWIAHEITYYKYPILTIALVMLFITIMLSSIYFLRKTVEGAISNAMEYIESKARSIDLAHMRWVAYLTISEITSRIIRLLEARLGTKIEL